MSLTTDLTAFMQTHACISCTSTLRPDGRLVQHAMFATPAAALAYKQAGHGGWVLDRYWYDCTYTPSHVMRDCPASGQLL